MPWGGRMAAAPLLEGHQIQLCPVGLEADSELLCVGNTCTAGGKFCSTDRMCVVRLDSEPCFSGTQNRKYRLPDRRGLEIENRPPNAILAQAGAVFRVHRMGLGLGLGAGAVAYREAQPAQPRLQHPAAAAGSSWPWGRSQTTTKITQRDPRPTRRSS